MDNFLSKIVAVTAEKPTVTGRNPASLPPQHQGVSTTRINSYDVARALAVLGMLVVNYFVIFLESFAGKSIFIALADLICGRAAALFVMLAGVGLTLLGRRAIDSGDKGALRLFRQQILLRCLVLYLLGHLLWLYWPADILHFYGLFLFVGAMVITWTGRTLWLLNLLILAVATWLYWFTGGQPASSGMFATSGIVWRNINNLLFTGNYSAFPWLSFMIAGIWFGKNRLISSNVSLGRISAVAGAIFIASEYLLRIAGVGDPDQFDTVQVLLLARTAFPLSPLYIVSAGSSAFLVLAATMAVCRFGLITALLKPFTYVGRLSLTIYIGHIFLAYAMFDYISANYAGAGYLQAVIAFYCSSTLFFMVFSAIWCRYFTYGPLEWLLRKVAKFQLSKS